MADLLWAFLISGAFLFGWRIEPWLKRRRNPQKDEQP